MYSTIKKLIYFFSFIDFEIGQQMKDMFNGSNAFLRKQLATPQRCAQVPTGILYCKRLFDLTYLSGPDSIIECLESYLKKNFDMVNIKNKTPGENKRLINK